MSAVTDPKARRYAGVRGRAGEPARCEMRSDISSSEPTCSTTPDSHSVTPSNTLARSVSICSAAVYTLPALSPHYTSNKQILAGLELH